MRPLAQLVRVVVVLGASTGVALPGPAPAIDRAVYEGGIAPNKLVWEEGDALPYAGSGAAADAAINRMIGTAADLYNLVASVSGGDFLSWDGADALLRGVYEDPAADCPSWSAASAYLCAGASGVETIAQSWGRGYVDSTHAPFRQWQPGALATSLADVFAEAADQLRAGDFDSPGAMRTVGRCSSLGAGPPPLDSSYRWLVGEDEPDGALRDLWTPECYGDPGKVSSPDYWCLAADDGGVTFNSTVPSHAFALLVDGGTFNGVAVGAIGLTRTLAVWWRAQASYLTPTSDFAAFADALEAACADLQTAGTNLPAPSVDSPVPSPSGLTISASHCAEVADAIAAVELRAAPAACGFEPLLAPGPGPAICAEGGSTAVLASFGFESGLQGWTPGRRAAVDPPDFDHLDWAAVSQLPDGRAGQAAFAADDPAIGNCDNQVAAGVLYLESPPFVVPAASNLRLAFDHWVATERGLDGGNLKYNVDGGAWTLVPASAFRFNAYPGTLDPATSGSDDPLAGEPAFTGSDEGAIDGSWGPSQVVLGALAPPGATVRFRFELGLDGCDGQIGWYVDDVAAVACGNCGNGLLDAGESCDDGDFTGGDGCSARCRVENAWSCTPPVPPVPDTDRVADGSFEGGTPSAAWDEASTNFGTPLCSGCGVGASDGDWLAWFGGSTVPEAASLEQMVTLPAGADTLRFDLWVGACDSAADALRVLVDGSELFDTGSCAVSPGYAEQVVDLGVLADGDAHLLRIEATTAAANSGASNFFLDRVSIVDPGEPGVPSECTPPSDWIFGDDFEGGSVALWSFSTGGGG